LTSVGICGILKASSGKWQRTSGFFVSKIGQPFKALEKSDVRYLSRWQTVALKILKEGL